MVKAKELRIGNLIKCEGGIGNVIAINIDTIDIIIINYNKGYSLNIFNINPIPLTKEMLLKAGFEKTWNIYNIDNFFIVELNEIFDVWFNDKDLKITIQYVHQLQNLYFCLIGKELNFNL